MVRIWYENINGIEYRYELDMEHDRLDIFYVSPVPIEVIPMNKDGAEFRHK